MAASQDFILTYPSGVLVKDTYGHVLFFKNADAARAMCPEGGKVHRLVRAVVDKKKVEEYLKRQPPAAPPG